MHNYGSVFRTVASETIDRTDNRYDNAVEFIIARLDASPNLGGILTLFCLAIASISNHSWQR